MKKIILKIKCDICEFKVEHAICVNECGYFVIPEMYCPNDLCRLEAEMHFDIPMPKIIGVEA